MDHGCKILPIPFLESDAVEWFIVSSFGTVQSDLEAFPMASNGFCPCRFPTLPVAELHRHQAPVNGLAWAPHSSCHICTAGDDMQALIWDLSSMSQPLDQGLGDSRRFLAVFRTLQI